MTALKIVSGEIKAAPSPKRQSLSAFEIVSLLDQKRISKTAYIQLALTLEFGVNGRPAFENEEHAREFAERWSCDDKGGKIKSSDLWSAIAKYLKQFDDDEEHSFPLLDYLEEVSK